MELCLSQKGQLYNIIPLDIKRKADRYLYEILNTKQAKTTINNIKTVQDYYEYHLKTTANN